jgi:uncharacterized phosphosugar-binding protein
VASRSGTVGVTSLEPPGRRYLDRAGELVARLATDEWPAIDAAAALVADSISEGGTLHAFGSGHSHMLAEELFYRAGGLVRVRPLLFEGLMLHAGAEVSTALERLPGLADVLFADHGMRAGDVLIVVSNSGGNVVSSALARLARDAGVRVIALVSRAHATSRQARTTDSARLHEIADIVIDNGGIVGDAAVEVDGMMTRVGPTSTVVGAAALNAIVVEAVARLRARGVTPDVFTSSNVEGGDAANARLLHPESVR